MRHCDVDFEYLDTWVLKNIEGFKQRVLIIGKCPNCKKKVVALKEVRIADNQSFEDIQVGLDAEKIAKREKKRIDYTLRQSNNYPTKWVLGLNIQIKNKLGEITQIRQYACNYRDKNKTLIKKIIV